MSTIGISARRTFGSLRNMSSTSVVVGLFLSVVSALFVHGLHAAEGEKLSAAVIWALSASPVLPLLAAFLGMDSWSEDRRTGHLDMLLTTAASEWDLTLGKFLGVWTAVMLTTLASLVSACLLLRLSSAACAIEPAGAAYAFAALAVQGALWTAVSVFSSSLCRHSAFAAGISVLLLSALPRGLWAVISAFSPECRSAAVEMPLDAQIVDIASGFVSTGTILTYLLLSIFFLLFAAIAIGFGRMSGHGGRWKRLCSIAVVLSSMVFFGLAISLVQRLDYTFETPVPSSAGIATERIRSILGETHGNVSTTCFLSHSDPTFRTTARFLRRFSRLAAECGGARLTLDHVDPSWDAGPAMRLIRQGVKPGSIVLSQGRRRLTLEIGGGLTGPSTAAALLRLTKPPQQRIIGWTSGHGEAAYDDYGPCGMSDIARELAKNGFVNRTVDLLSSKTIPSDCAMIIAAGAKNAFSRIESSRLDSYLKLGGRLLALTGPDPAEGVNALLSGWGIATSTAGGDLPKGRRETLITDFSDHPVASPLRGSGVMLDFPATFEPSAVVKAATAADRIMFSPIASLNSAPVAVGVERGVSAGGDVGLKPTRVIAVGDATFVLNASLAARANANRDLFLNAVAYLSGAEAPVGSGSDGGTLVTGLDRRSLYRMLAIGSAAIPGFVALTLFLIAVRRRHRS